MDTLILQLAVKSDFIKMFLSDGKYVQSAHTVSSTLPDSWVVDIVIVKEKKH